MAPPCSEQSCADQAQAASRDRDRGRPSRSASAPPCRRQPSQPTPTRRTFGHEEYPLAQPRLFRLCMVSAAVIGDQDPELVRDHARCQTNFAIAFAIGMPHDVRDRLGNAKADSVKLLGRGADACRVWVMAAQAAGTVARTAGYVSLNASISASSHGPWNSVIISGSGAIRPVGFAEAPASPPTRRPIPFGPYRCLYAFPPSVRAARRKRARTRARQNQGQDEARVRTRPPAGVVAPAEAADRPRSQNYCPTPPAS